MEPERKKMIIREIEYWRNNKLLPEQYCDFLRNLYSDQTSHDNRRKNGGFAAFARESGGKAWALAIGIIAMVSFFFVNFNSFPQHLQMFLSGILICGMYVWGFARLRKHPLVANALIGLSSLFMLLIGEYLIREGGGLPWNAAGYIAICGLVWIALGLMLRNALLHVSGWMALNMFYAWVVYAVFSPVGLWETQLFWFPFVVLFAWLGWGLIRTNKSTGSVLLFVACILWFMPELYDFAVRENSVFTQIFAGGKIAIFSLALFLYRKKWTEWI